MNNLSKSIERGINITNKKNNKKKSPLSEKYKNFLKSESTSIKSKSKDKSKGLNNIMVNVIKKETQNKKDPVKKEPVKKDPVKKEPVKKEPVKKGSVKKGLVRKTRKSIESGVKRSISHIKLRRGSGQRGRGMSPSIKVMLSKDKNKQKHRFTKKSRGHEKKNVRNSGRRKQLHKRHTKSRKVSFKCYPQNNDKDIEEVIKKINKMSDKSLKEELLKEGIKIKSNKKSLLKDIYMFSMMGGIKIHKE